MNEIRTDYGERSLSKRLMDGVVRISTNSFVQRRYSDYSIWMRSLDNEVDEGTSSTQASEVINRHVKIALGQACPQTGDELEQRLERILAMPLELAASAQNRRYLLLLLEYFKVDLEHRMSLQAFSKSDLNTHIEGGFPACLGSIAIILNNRPVLHPGFTQLLRIHGMAEPLGDITEDLERGFVPHSREDGANWVDRLQEGNKVPAEEIDQYLVSRRGKLAYEMLRLSPWAAIEIPTLVGSLMSLEYMRRAIRLSRRRYQPREDVIFAKYRMGD